MDSLIPEAVTGTGSAFCDLPGCSHETQFIPLCLASLPFSGVNCASDTLRPLIPPLFPPPGDSMAYITLTSEL